MDILIRPATPADALGLATVQVNSYRTAYAHEFPQSWLDNFSYAEQAQDWRDALRNQPDDILLVAVASAESTLEPENGVRGYILARAQPDDLYPSYLSELVALHVLQAFQRQGIGARLLHAATSALQARGCHATMLWTMRSNPIRPWYASLGGHLLGEKSVQADTRTIVEVAYGWPDSAVLLTRTLTPTPR